MKPTTIVFTVLIATTAMLLSVGEAKAQQGLATPRYTTQVIVGPGGGRFWVMITDHHANMLYSYEMNMNGTALSLMGSFNLAKAGKPEIQGKFPASRPTTMPTLEPSPTEER
jgi:hypothetical protein